MPHSIPLGIYVKQVQQSGIYIGLVTGPVPEVVAGEVTVDNIKRNVICDALSKVGTMYMMVGNDYNETLVICAYFF